MIRRFLPLSLLLPLFTLLRPAAAAADSSVSLKAVIDEVMSNESLYDSVEVMWSTRYKLNSESEIDSRVIRNWTTSGREVLQGGKHFYNIDRSQTMMKGNMVSLDSALAFDGTQTVVLEQSVANIRRGRYEGHNMMRPHMALLAHAHLPIPLSTVLQGTTAIRANPLTKQYSLGIRATVEGDEDLEGLKCIRVRLDMYSEDGTKVTSCYLWLATERNYLPIKVFSVGHPYSSTLSIEEAEVGELREIGPGVWFPFSVARRVFDERLLAEGKHELLSTTSMSVDTAKLDPTYDDSLFKSITIPDGLPVYVLDERGTIVGSYIQGGRGSGTPGWLRFLFLGITVAVVLALAVIARRRGTAQKSG